MWWNQLCAWVVLQCESESSPMDQVQWKSLIVSIPEETQCPDKYQAFLNRWRALTAEGIGDAYSQKLLSIIDRTLAYLQQAS